jgi:hypothetical protein
MTVKRVIYCSNDKVHPRLTSSKILLIVEDSCLYAYCSDRTCERFRHGTWTKIQFTKCGKPISFKNSVITQEQMPINHHFDLTKQPIMVKG